jgi:hypothetical protein
MFNERVVTVFVVIVLPFVLTTVPLVLLNKAFKNSMNQTPIRKVFRSVIWFLAAGFLIFVSLGVPIILYNVTTQNTASVITFLIFFVAGVPLMIWLDKNAYVLRDLAHPIVKIKWLEQQQQRQEEEREEVNEEVREMPRIVIEDAPKARPNNGAPVPVNPRVRR